MDQTTEVVIGVDLVTATFETRANAEKFMYSLVGGEIPSVGKVELSWIQTPLPPVALNAAGKVVKVEDMDMGEGDAMAATSSPAHGNAQGHDRQQGDLDYDVADDNDWDQIQ